MKHLQSPIRITGYDSNLNTKPPKNQVVMKFSSKNKETFGRKIVPDFCGYLRLFIDFFYSHSTAHSTAFFISNLLGTRTCGL